MKDGFSKITFLTNCFNKMIIEENARKIAFFAHNNYELSKTNILITPPLSLIGGDCGSLMYKITTTDECIKALFLLADMTKDIDTLIGVGLPLYNSATFFNAYVWIKDGKILAFNIQANTSRNSFFSSYKVSSEKDNGPLPIPLHNNGHMFMVPIINKMVFEFINISGFVLHPFFASDIEDDIGFIKNSSTSLALCLDDNLNGDITNQTRSSNFCKGIALTTNTSVAYISETNFGILNNYGEKVKKLANNYTFLFDAQSSALIKSSDPYKKEKPLDYRINMPIPNIGKDEEYSNLRETYSPTPFEDFCENYGGVDFIIETQSSAIAKKLENLKLKKMVLGLSSGLDSTLVAIAAKRACKILNLDDEALITISMPGLGTSKLTEKIEKDLIKALNLKNHRVIPISEVVKQHLKDINHPLSKTNNTFENAQSRERAQVLFDIANDENALVLGTGDLSECFLGWCTYLGDQAYHFNPNATIPKSLIKYIMLKLSDEKKELQVLKTIAKRTISPELLPKNKKGESEQNTEKSVGPYPVLDFAIYHIIRDKWDINKTIKVAKAVFTSDTYKSEDIEKWLINMNRRFIQNQFKRQSSGENAIVMPFDLSQYNCIPNDINFN